LQAFFTEFSFAASIHIYLFTIFCSLFTALFFLQTTFKNRTNRRFREQLEAMKVGGFIAHEVRAPLATIQVSTSFIQRDLPELLSAYEYAHQHDPLQFRKSPQQFSMLNNLVNNMQAATRSASNIIDILLVKVNQESKIDSGNYQSYTIKTVITEAIQRYPFQPDDDALVHWQADANPDFTFHGDELLTIHILFNLIRNALFHIKAARKGEIFISTKTDNKYNYLMVKDTGPGIPKESVHKIFERSFTTSSQGIGLGLNFCRTVMDSYDGKISVASVFGEYTEFTLAFPRLA
jgi:signal transduction histidine kinase